MRRKTEIAVFAGAAVVALGWWLWPSAGRDGCAVESVRAKSWLIAGARPQIRETKEMVRTQDDGVDMPAAISSGVPMRLPSSSTTAMGPTASRTIW